MHNYFYFYFYSIVSGIALGIHLIINWHQLFNWRNVKTRVDALVEIMEQNKRKEGRA